MPIDRAQLKLIMELLVNLVLPWLTYRTLIPHMSEFGAIAWSAAPPTAWSALELARHRRLDAISLMVLAGIALSLAALLFGGSARMLMVRENLFSIPIGLVFLASLGMRRPLIYHAARAVFSRSAPDLLARFETAWQQPPILRGMRVMSLVWGVGLIVQGALLGWMAWTWPVERYLIVSPVIGYGIFVMLGFWTSRYRKTLAARAV